jgi:hypothetical protein
MDRRAQDELMEVLEALRQQVGPNGLIVPVGSMRYHPSAVRTSGFVYPLNLVARAFANPDTGHIDLALPKVLVYDGVLLDNTQLRQGLGPVFEQVMGAKGNRTLAVFALDLDGVVLDALVATHQRNMCTIAAIGCFGLELATAQHYLQTVARICGATVLTARSGWAWANALGSAGRILAAQNRAVIIEPARIEQAQMPPQAIGLLSVGGANAQDVLEGIEWIEGLMGH